jgi:hypothetical protein
MTLEVGDSNMVSPQLLLFLWSSSLSLPIPVAARSTAYICGRSSAEIVGSNSTKGMDFVVIFVCYQVEVFATDWSLVQRIYNDYSVSLCVI